MSAPTWDLHGLFLVLAGSFNPSIFHPSWLATKGLISQAEADAAQVEVMHPDLAVVRVGWLGLHVERNVFQVQTHDPSFASPLRDLVVGLFTLLEHTPVQALGVLRGVHLKIDDEMRWHRMGDALAPKEPWGGVLDPSMARPDGSSHPGLRSLVMEGRRPGSSGRWLRMKFEASNLIRPGVYLEVHEHFEATGPDGLQTLLGVLRREWDETLAFADGAARRLLANVGMP